MPTVRRPAVAGWFYPIDSGELASTVNGLLDEVPAGGAAPKAIIAPHAGYVYSGPVAATAYAQLRSARGEVRRVVLVGPSHRVPLAGLAFPSVDAFASPLGALPVDREALERLAALPQVVELDEPHADEHSLEVHLPFLSTVLGEVAIVPLVAGFAAADEVSEVLDALWGGPETLVVVSSDLSHYHDYETARRLDAGTTRAIEELAGERIDPDRACGSVPIGGLLWTARRRGLTATTLDVRNSGDTAGTRDSVVGYGAYAFA